jgi:hypothetical protein
MVTIYSDIYSKKAYHRPIEFVLERIKTGVSKDKVLEIRKQLDKERANTLKKNLPSVCFSGKFTNERTDSSIIEHSGFIVLDFDNIYDVPNKRLELQSLAYCYACWVSPSGNGLKMLVKIADGKKHLEHFHSLKKELPEIDDSGKNTSRVCYESWDKGIYINHEAKTYLKTQKTERIEIKERVEDSSEIFNNILKWLTNRGNAFVTGERNAFIFKLASACCRFGMSELSCQSNCDSTFLNQDSSFSQSECHAAIKSAFRANRQLAGSAAFEKDILVDKVTRSEVKEEINPDIYNEDIKPKDVIYGEDVKERAINIFRNGYESVESTGIPELDYYFKFKRGEITLLSGIGNYGKSTMLKYLLLMKAIISGNRFAFFTPEDNPAEEFYHDMTEIYLGCDCTTFNPNQPSEMTYKEAYDWISKHIFYIYPKDISPTPEYIKERFLELIIKEKVDGCIIDPFNQMANDYSKVGRSDKYLETFLADCTRFAQTNNVYFVIVAHPHKLRKEQGEKNYPCPDVFEIADGAMWNNKMDNILIYHRPNHQTEPDSQDCELHTKKIRRQKTVGKKGVLEFELNRRKRRYLFNGKDYMADYIYSDKTLPQSYGIRDTLEPLPLDQVPF